jgi:hypothetical protein
MDANLVITLIIVVFVLLLATGVLIGAYRDGNGPWG